MKKYISITILTIIIGLSQTLDLLSQMRYIDKLYKTGPVQPTLEYRPLIAENPINHEYLSVCRKNTPFGTGYKLDVIRYDAYMNIMNAYEVVLYTSNARIDFTPQQLKFDAGNYRYVLVGYGTTTSSPNLEIVAATFTNTGYYNYLCHYPAATNIRSFVSFDIVRNLYVIGHCRSVVAFNPNGTWSVQWAYQLGDPQVEPFPPVICDITHDWNNNTLCVGYLSTGDIETGKYLFYSVIDALGNPPTTNYYSLPYFKLDSQAPIVCKFSHYWSSLVVGMTLNEGTYGGYDIFRVYPLIPNNANNVEYHGAYNFKFPQLQDLYIKDDISSFFVNGWLRNSLTSNTPDSNFMSQIKIISWGQLLHRRYRTIDASTNMVSHLNFSQLVYNSGANNVVNFGSYKISNIFGTTNMYQGYYVTDVDNMPPYCNKNDIPYLSNRYTLPEPTEIKYEDYKLTWHTGFPVDIRIIDYKPAITCPETIDFAFADDIAPAAPTIVEDQPELKYIIDDYCINFNVVPENTMYQIFDIYGKSLIGGELTTTLISISSLPSGVYFLTLKQNNNSVLSNKFVIIR